MSEQFQDFHRILSLVGVTIFATKNWDSKLWLSFQIFSVIIGSLTFVFTSGFVILNISDLPVFIEGASIWTTAVIMTISLWLCLVFRRKLRQFLTEVAFRDAIFDVDLIKYISNQEVKSPYLRDLKNMIFESQHKVLKFTKLMINVYFYYVCALALMYIGGGVYKMVTRDDESARFLAFEIWFPWSLDNMLVYYLSFIFHAYCASLCCISYPGLQITIIFLLSQTIRQLRILTFITENLDQLVRELTAESDELWQDYCTVILSQCIQHYISLKKFNNRLNTICRPFYLALILVAIMLVCVCSTKIAISNKFAAEILKYYIHELCFIAVVMLFCLYGQQIDNECEKLEQAIYEKWYIYNTVHKKNLAIFGMAVHQKMPIFIFGSIKLSLPTFTWFIKTGMSFFTLMMSFLEEQA